MDEEKQEPPTEATRDAAGRFLPGVSGNPAGKPKGTRSWANEIRAELRTKSAMGVLAAMHRHALAGDVRAAQLVLSFVLPQVRPGDLTEELGDPAASLGQQAKEIVGKMIEGSLAPAEAKDALEVVALAGQIDEVEQLRQRLDLLEAALAAGGPHGIPG